MKLKIYKRGSIWWGRTEIPGSGNRTVNRPQIYFSSKTSNKKDAERILNDWFNDRYYELRHGKLVSTLPVVDFINRYSEYLKDQVELKYKKKNYYDNFKSHIKPIIRFIQDKKIKKFTIKTLKVDYIDFRRNEKLDVKNTSLRLEINELRNVMNYALQNELCSKNDIPTYPTFKKEENSRTFFRPEEYKKLLRVSRSRSEARRDKRLAINVREVDVDKRFQLHQWIIFMTGSGLRVDECKGLKFGDIRIQSGKDKLELVVSGKTGSRKVVTESSSYHALIKLKEHYLKKGISFQKDDYVFKVRSFQYLFNELLEVCDLKFDKVTGKKRDTKSLRQTYISWEVVKGEKNLIWIAKNCGNSIGVIHSNYANNLQHEDFFKEQIKTISFI